MPSFHNPHKLWNKGQSRRGRQFRGKRDKLQQNSFVKVFYSKWGTFLLIAISQAGGDGEGTKGRFFFRRKSGEANQKWWGHKKIILSSLPAGKKLKKNSRKNKQSQDATLNRHPSLRKLKHCIVATSNHWKAQALHCGNKQPLETSSIALRQRATIGNLKH